MSWVKKASSNFGFWLSPSGQVIQFPYGLFDEQTGYWHADAIEEELLPISKSLRERVLNSDYPEDALMKYGWARGVVQGNEEASVEVGEGTDIETTLGHLPFVTQKLIVDKGKGEWYALLLNEGEDFVTAWRNRNRPRVFAKRLHRPR